MTTQSDEAADGLLALVRQMLAALTADSYFAALAIALTLPDICCGYESSNGKATASRYRKWFAENIKAPVTTADGTVVNWPALIYGFRCSFLHQGSAAQANQVTVGFVEPGGPIHAHWSSMEAYGETLYLLDLSMFVDEIAQAVVAWVSEKKDADPVKSNLAKSIRRRPEGLRPFIRGIPVIA